MKKLFLLTILLMMCVTSFSQFSLKNYTLGDKYYGEKEVVFSLGNIDGGALIVTTEDDYIYMILWIPIEGENVKRIYSSDADMLIDGIKEKFGIDLYLEDENEYDDKFYLKYSDDKYIVSCKIEQNEYLEPPVKMSITLIDKKLFEQETEREKNKNLTDF